MLRSIFVGSFLVSFALAFAGSASAADRNKSKPPEPTPAEVEAREHVHQALLAETLGDNTARAKRLSTAWIDLPDLPEANWHLGRVQVAGKWLPLAEAEALAAEDANLRKYRQQRDEAKNPKMLLNLARWCEKNGREDAANLHYTQLATSVDATEDARLQAIKALGLVRTGDLWVSPDELAHRDATMKSIDGALKAWRGKLKKLQELIDGPNYEARSRAIDDLWSIENPQIIPVLESFLVDGGDRFQEESVKRLAEFPQHDATEALVRFAVLSKSFVVRDLAISNLKERPVHDFVPLLLSGLTAPLKSQYEVTERRGEVQYTHVITREAPHANYVAVTAQVAVPVVSRQSLPAGVSNREVRELLIQQKKLEAENLAADVELQATLANARLAPQNERYFKALEGAAPVQLPREYARWWSWWLDYNEYHWPKPTQSVFLASQHRYWTPPATSCFLAGTPVRTQTGLVAIETIQPGDRVLAQDQDTGELTYKLVLRTTLRPPADMLKIKAGTEEIVTTLGHPFWVNNHGWRMAKQLKEGDLLHSVGGAIRIDAVEPMPNQPAHNLVVADFNTYFVGKQGLLVHDNEYRKPTRSIVPGLAAAE